MKAKPKTAEDLTPKQKLFADYYLGEARFVGVRAAEMAGYKGNYSTLCQVAAENIRKPYIRAYLDDRLSALTMPANVVLTRLTEIANGKIDDVLGEDGKFDLVTAKKKDKTHLIKKLKIKSTSKKVDAVVEGSEEESETLETSLLYEEVEFELYSAHEALRDLGRHHKLFTERHELSGNLGFSWSDISNEAADKKNLTNAD